MFHQPERPARDEFAEHFGIQTLEPAPRLTHAEHDEALSELYALSDCVGFIPAEVLDMLAGVLDRRDGAAAWLARRIAEVGR